MIHGDDDVLGVASSREELSPASMMVISVQSLHFKVIKRMDWDLECRYTF